MQNLTSHTKNALFLPLSDPRQSKLVLWLAGIQFVNIVDFMMIMPLGPDLSSDLGIPLSKMGLLGGSYALAASIFGIAASKTIDRFDRRPALCFVLFFLGLATLSTAFAQNLSQLIAARVMAGAFGGPATALAMAIIADRFDPRERGQVIGRFMLAFSLASIAGIPLGLELAHLGGWKLPFLILSACTFLMATWGYRALPSLKGHLASPRPQSSVFSLSARKSEWLSHLAMGLAMSSAFLLIPNIATYIQENLHFPREHLGRLYLGGGIASYLGARFGGRLVDAKGSVKVAWLATVLVVFVMLFGFAYPLAMMTPALIFMVFMVGMALRNVAQQTLASKVPAPSERAGFMSVQSSVQHMSCALGAYVSSRILYDIPGQGLGGIRETALLASLLFFFVPILMSKIEVAQIQPQAEEMPALDEVA